jgi:hypothetical protein
LISEFPITSIRKKKKLRNIARFVFLAQIGSQNFRRMFNLFFHFYIPFIAEISLNLHIDEHQYDYIKLLTKGNIHQHTPIDVIGNE